MATVYRAETIGSLLRPAYLKEDGMGLGVRGLCEEGTNP